jgi:NDP-sugar pyrophosphorylase family protein
MQSGQCLKIDSTKSLVMKSHPSPSCAVILAAGKGSRMNHPKLPKPLVPFMGRPLLEWVISGICKSGINRIIVVIGWRGELIRSYLGSHYQGTPLLYSTQHRLTGTADAIASAMPLISNDEVVLLALGDVIVKPDWYSCLCNLWNKRPYLDALLTLVASNPSLGSMVSFNSRLRATSILSRPVGVQDGWRDGGISLFNYDSLLALTSVDIYAYGEHRMTYGISNQIRQGKTIGVEIYTGPWYDMMSQDAIKKAEGVEASKPIWI